MFKKIAKVIGGDPTKREIQKLAEIVEQINQLEAQFELFSDDALKAKTGEFRHRLAEGETLDDLLIEAFAIVREVSKRTLGLRHFDVQLIGGIVLHQGKIAEMRTGEGKTLAATMPLYLNGLTGRGTHLVTVNDYLARRDARWMAPIYHVLGLKVGVLQMAARTGGGKKAFIVDLDHTSSQEDQHQLRLVPRREAYEADVTYGTNSEFGFDYLRDNITMRLEDRVQPGHHFVIIDEVDNILIDEARTPLIISGPAQDESEWYARMAQVVRQLRPEDYEIGERERMVTLTEIGETHVEELLDMALRDPDRPEDINPEQARVLGYLEQGLRAQHLYKRNKEYLVRGGKVVIVDEFTGRLMPGRRWSEGLHQAVEAKEGVKIEPENITYATITLQNYFRMYEKLSGMTGTAVTEAEEFSKIYNLEVLPIPTNLEYIASLPDSELLELQDRDAQGYRYTYYAQENDPERVPIFWKRKDYTDVVYRSQEGKLRAITQEIVHYFIIGRPQLVGTTSVEHSELLSSRLKTEPIRRLMQSLLIRQAWLEKNEVEIIGRSVPELEPLNRPISELKAGDLRSIARGLGISLNPENPTNVERLIGILNLQQKDLSRLEQVLQGGVPHQVLNARIHDAEAEIIACAGAFGAVTVATNMAGRGVDIKLGGELPEDIIRDTNRVLGRAGDDPYDMTNEERRSALLKMQHEQYGIYEESVKKFLQYVEDMDGVRRLGGLHVIGSERHEARRIDNQLRGRAARQGDPGSSRFYLSLEDELMRLFGGQQVESLWKRIMFDENQPIELNLLGRMVEQSQERVEGANFDVRKHLLEYDDVLNTQRHRIYHQRDRVFNKEDLSEDILDMLRIELQKRIPESLKDKEGPWKLLAYLDEIQPSINYELIYYPSFTLQLLFNEIRKALPESNPSVSNLRDACLDLAKNALETEKEHLILGANALLEKVKETINRHCEERFEIMDTFLDGIEFVDEGATEYDPQEQLRELSALVRVPFKLKKVKLNQLDVSEPEVNDALREQIENYVVGMNITRLIGALERRLEENLGIKASQLQRKTWQDVTEEILQAVEAILNKRIERLVGDDGLIIRDLDHFLKRLEGISLTDRLLYQLLILMAQGTRLAFDTKTHRRSRKRYVRLRYVHLAAYTLEVSSPEAVTEIVLLHMEAGLLSLQQVRGLMLWNRLVQTEINLQQLDKKFQNYLSESLGVERYEAMANQPLSSFDENVRMFVCDELGKRFQNEAYRQLLLRVISEQWVEYLTKVEALRVSIRMEAYAQRDPLVQYKGQATEMFKRLLEDIRMGVISRMFTYQPKQFVGLGVERDRLSDETSTPVPAEVESKPKETGKDKKRKKRRRRH